MNEVVSINDTASLGEDTSIEKVFYVNETGLLNEAASSSNVFSLD